MKKQAEPRNLPPKTSSLDYIPTVILKDCSDAFGHIIARLANLSFTEEKFPNMFKVGQFMPLLKKPSVDIDDMSINLPITNLNTIGKLLERLAQGNTSKVQPMRHPCSPHTVHSTETVMTRVVSDLLSTTDGKTRSTLSTIDDSSTAPRNYSVSPTLFYKG